MGTPRICITLLMLAGLEYRNLEMDGVVSRLTEREFL
jgi:hypothetical protein